MADNMIIGLIGAFGIGSMATALVSHFLGKGKDLEARRFAEKKEAYAGLLEAYLMVAAASEEQADHATLNYQMWLIRVELAGSPEAILQGKRIMETAPYSPERNAAHDALIAAIKKDLNIEPSKA